MDGIGELFADFLAALHDAVVPLVVSYPNDRALDYETLTNFARARLPPDRPFVLLGESFSGPVAIALAAFRPPGLRGLILCCSFARNPVPAFSVFKHLLGALPVAASFTGLIAPFLLGANSTPTLRSALRSAVGQVAAPVMRARLRAVLEADYSAQLREVGVPVLYLQASRDWIVPAGAARHLTTLVPAIEVARIDGPHLLLQAKADQAADIVRRFIGSLLS